MLTGSGTGIIGSFLMRSRDVLLRLGTGNQGRYVNVDYTIALPKKTLTRAAMLTLTTQSRFQKRRYRFLFIFFLTLFTSFDTPPEDFHPTTLTGGVFDVRANEEIKRFMATASDSVLTILNGNLWMLPGGLSIDKEERIDRFISYARQLMPHVITLQEVWTMDLVAYLESRFPEFHVVASGQGGSVNTAGLVTLSRVPSDSTAFSAFPVAQGASLLEKQARKGYLTVHLEMPTFKASIINTHLYSPTCEQDQAFVAHQFNTLKQIDTSGYTFIVGDLNLAQQAFERLNDSFFLTEQDTSYTVDPTNKYRSRGSNSIRAKKVDSYKVDRLLMPQAHGEHFSLKSMLIRDPIVSDHYLLAYRIERH